jgi:hypothetical protein
MHQFRCFLKFHPIFFCFSLMLLDNRVFVSHASWQSSNFVYELEMLQTASVKVQAMNVRCRVSKWTMTTVNEKCLKLRVASAGCRVSKWMSVRVLSEWVRCRIFGLVRRQNNKRSQKPPKANLCPSHHHHHAKDRCARRLSMKGCCVRGASTKGSFIMSSTITQVSLQLTY